MRVKTSLPANSISLGRNIAIAMRSQLVSLSVVTFLLVMYAHKETNIADMIVGSVLIIAVFGIVTMYNDLQDVEIDRHNKRYDIPLVASALTRQQLMISMTVLTAITVILGAFLGHDSLLWASVYLFLGFLYSGLFSGKDRPYGGPVILGICYGAMPWLLGFLVSEKDILSLLNVVVMVASVVFVIGIITLKDFKDLKGDKAFGKKTLLVERGSSFVNHWVKIWTTSAYGIVITYCLVTGSSAEAALTLVIALLNYQLLRTNQLTFSARSRATRGNAARGLFYFSICLVYVLRLS